MFWYFFFSQKAGSQLCFRFVSNGFYIYSAGVCGTVMHSDLLYCTACTVREEKMRRRRRKTRNEEEEEEEKEVEEDEEEKGRRRRREEM